MVAVELHDEAEVEQLLQAQVRCDDEVDDEAETVELFSSLASFGTLQGLST